MEDPLTQRDHYHHIKNHHNPEYHKKSCAGANALKTEKAKTSRKIAYDKRKKETWDKRSIKQCIICNTELTYPQTKTCSDVCQKLYLSRANSKPMTEQRRQNISDGVQQYLKSIGYKKKTTKICNHCEKEFTPKSNESYCSEQCKQQLKLKTSKKISIALKKAFKEGRHLGNQYRNRTNKSFLERSFIDYINHNYANLEYEFNKPIRILNEQNQYIKCFYIDFYFPKQNIGIELDGSQHEQNKSYDFDRDKTIKNLKNIDIIRITYKEYMSKERKYEIDNILKREITLQNGYH